MDVQITQITSQLLKKTGIWPASTLPLSLRLAVAPVTAIFYDNSSQFSFRKSKQA